MNRVKLCIVKDCNGRNYCKSFCRKHYERVNRHGSTDNILFKHGLSGTPEYDAWLNMVRRCTNPKYIESRYYIDRGITVCAEWLESFERFYEDMGNKPSPTYSLDRIDNEQGYFKENCRWATKRQQVINRRVNKNNKSGHKGVYWRPKEKRWQACVFSKGNKISLGFYRLKEDAINARKQGERVHYV